MIKYWDVIECEEAKVKVLPTCSVNRPKKIVDNAKRICYKKQAKRLLNPPFHDIIKKFEMDCQKVHIMKKTEKIFNMSCVIILKTMCML